MKPFISLTQGAPPVVFPCCLDAAAVAVTTPFGLVYVPANDHLDFFEEGHCGMTTISILFNSNPFLIQWKPSGVRRLLYLVLVIGH